MPSDDELRRVAEDVRALARSLGRDIRTAFDRARDDMSGPGGHADPVGRRSAREDFADARRAARREFHRAQAAFRQSTSHGYEHDRTDEGADDIEGLSGPPRGPGYPPRWDNWGGRYYRDPTSTQARRPRPPRPQRGPRGRDRAQRHGWMAEPITDLQERTVAPAPIPEPPLRHRHDGSTLLGLLAVVFGLAWLAAGTHLAHLPAETVVAIALMVVGASTVVTARTDWALSRRWWPVMGGALLGVALLAFSASPTLPVGFRHLEFGSRSIIPTSWAEVPSVVHGGFGRTVIDLTGLQPPPPAPMTLAVDNAAGQLVINLPTDLKVVVDARDLAGQIVVNGVAISGLHRAESQTINPSVAGPALSLDVRSGFGNVVINSLSPVTKTAPVPPTPLAPGIVAPGGVKQTVVTPLSPGGVG